MVQDKDVILVTTEQWYEVIYGLSNSSIFDDHEWHSRTFHSLQAFAMGEWPWMSLVVKWDLLYTCAAINEISTDIVHHIFPLRWLSFLFIWDKNQLNSKTQQQQNNVTFMADSEFWKGRWGFRAKPHGKRAMEVEPQETETCKMLC